MSEQAGHHRRMVEAVLFAASVPVEAASLAARLPEDADVEARLAELAQSYANRGVNLVRVAGGWAFRTAPDLAFLLRQQSEVPKRLSRAAVETLAIIAYHQPATRADIEEVRGVSISRGTLDLLFEAGWVRPVGRRRSPGRPVTYGTTNGFLEHFGLNDVADLPGIDELKAAGFLDTRPARALQPVGVGGDRTAEAGVATMDGEGESNNDESAIDSG